MIFFYVVITPRKEGNMKTLQSIETLDTEKLGMVLSVRAAFIEAGYNFLVNPSTDKGRSFVRTLRQDLTSQRFSYTKAQLPSIVKLVLEKIAREWKLQTADIQTLIDDFEILK